ncbi:RNA polymerase sigma factor [Flavihumibacter solisilvae]|uniref:RNA polymerase sigma factor n=1 Tax=Flavihumibacter solisilvae TaxID=1349421 RepID=A0A0C1L3D2_9BACT|nr:sigma-70 family RNA polymerase sigma factor [Flavihumibacter solisilvae]KIC94111.1 hypothetical protein OI18_14030 [Flavihumibacter solisilvae]
MDGTEVSKLVSHLFRHESGKMTSVLARLLGMQHLHLAQDIIQDTLLQAMNSWPYSGIPENPQAWLYHVARNKAIDALRRNKKFREIRSRYAMLLQSEWTLSPTVHQLFMDNEIEDSQLRMMFACCHPSIPTESQVALVLKTLCGLSISEIAHAFLTTDETIAKRIYRAKEKIRTECIELEVPEGDALKDRLDAVLKSLYLLFNEGYNASNPAHFIRENLCSEAMRLCALLCSHPLTGLPRTHALMALCCFQSSRLSSRLDENGQIILLKYQDRSTWDKELISNGFAHLELAAEPFEVSAYHLEAAIASRHAAAASFGQTDWLSIFNLYEHLFRLQPNPVVAMNRAIASAYAIGIGYAIGELHRITGLEGHYLYHASLGELYIELSEFEKAHGYFEKAYELASSEPEKQLLSARMALCKMKSPAERGIHVKHL